MNNYNELLQHFDNIFETATAKNIDFDSMKLLKLLYDRLEENIITPNAEYEKVRHERVKLSSKFRETLSTEQQQVYEQCNELLNQMQSIECEQLFVFGFIIAKELEFECKNK